MAETESKVKILNWKSVAAGDNLNTQCIITPHTALACI